MSQSVSNKRSTKKKRSGAKITKRIISKRNTEHHTLQKPEYSRPKLGRVVFTSIATLLRDWRKLPVDVLAECLLFLDCDRSWVFHGIEGEDAFEFYKTGFDARFIDCDAEFKEFIQRKEEDGHVFWWRPVKNWKVASAFFEGIIDPARGPKFSLLENRDPEPLPYFPFILSKPFWTMLGGTDNWKINVRDARKLGAHSPMRWPQFTASVQKVILNFESNSFEEFSSREMLYQSNPSLRFYGYDLTPIKERPRIEVE